MYASSRVAACAYCSAHTFAFALRRGAKPASLTGYRDLREEVVFTVAEAMARVPSDLTTSQCVALTEHFSTEDVEWIVLSIGLMGFLNKFMDALGVELESKSINEVGALLTLTGWSPGQHAEVDVKIPNESVLPKKDSLGTYFRVLQQVPSAIRLEQHWTTDVPNQWPEAGVFLEKHTGHSFPILSHLRHKRVIRALTTVLRDNLDSEQSEVGLTAKCLAGFVYATVVKNKTSEQEARLIAGRLAPSLDETTFDPISRFAAKPSVEDISSYQQTLLDLSELPGMSKRDAAAILLARAASSSPARIDPKLLRDISPLLTPASIVELIVWLSVQQLLQRLGSFYAVTKVYEVQAECQATPNRTT
ncbi:MAG: hypothetical protein HC852_23690 [Acaryochloridaceae cyanobacterium RU_4_10]|nr:hypothetical protein [Acaryochloridaceae cyanobacterium RU_4_10]